MAQHGKDVFKLRRAVVRNRSRMARSGSAAALPQRAAMADALANEIMDAYQGQGASIRRRDEVHKMAQSNKAFAHFRW